jgi:hypothetical protein
MALALVLAAALLPAGALADPGDPPAVDLDQLLILPDEGKYTVEKKGGLTRGEWRARFQEVEVALAEHREALDNAEAALSEVATSSSAWQVSPIPGLKADGDAPLDFRLRQDIRTHRAEIERLESRLRELRIQANLAGVPEEWQS